MTTRTLVRMALYTAIALILSWLETLLPLPLPVPGAKVGLASLVTLVALSSLSRSQAFIVLMARILLSGFLFGSMSSILYALAGGFLSFAVMTLLISKPGHSFLFISILGAMAHNLGQLIVAACVVESVALLMTYLPFLLLLAIPAGIVTGSVAALSLCCLKKAHFIN